MPSPADSRRGPGVLPAVHPSDLDRLDQLGVTAERLVYLHRLVVLVRFRQQIGVAVIRGKIRCRLMRHLAILGDLLVGRPDDGRDRPSGHARVGQLRHQLTALEPPGPGVYSCLGRNVHGRYHDAQIRNEIPDLWNGRPRV